MIIHIKHCNNIIKVRVTLLNKFLCPINLDPTSSLTGIYMAIAAGAHTREQVTSRPELKPPHYH